MTFRTHDAVKHDLALRFGAALGKAMRRKGIGKRAISQQTGISRNSLTDYQRGRILPRFTSACRIADAVGDEELVRISRETRTLPCASCKQPFINDGQVNTRFCGPNCRKTAAKMKVGTRARDSSVKAERKLLIHREAVVAMCHACEPGGACRMADCPLRVVSPLPLVLERAPEVHALGGRWGTGSGPDGSPKPKKNGGRV